MCKCLGSAYPMAQEQRIGEGGGYYSCNTLPSRSSMATKAPLLTRPKCTCTELQRSSCGHNVGRGSKESLSHTSYVSTPKQYTATSSMCSAVATLDKSRLRGGSLRRSHQTLNEPIFPSYQVSHCILEIVEHR